MNPNLSALFSPRLLVFVLLIGASGCSTVTPASRTAAALPTHMPTYALAVAVRGGVEPTPEQWNAMYLKFSQALAARGLLLINDYTRAENIINVEFLPDPINPNVGTALISSIVPNTGSFGRTASVASSTYAASFPSYANRGFDPMWGSSYGYSDYDYYYGSNYTSPISAPAKPGTTPVTPPHRQHPTNPIDCPPGTSPYQPPPSYVGNQPHHRWPHDGGQTPPSSPPSSPGPQLSSSSSYASSNDSSSRSSPSTSSSSGPSHWWSSSSTNDSSSRSSASTASSTGTSHWWNSSSSSSGDSSSRPTHSYSSSNDSSYRSSHSSSSDSSSSYSSSGSSSSYSAPSYSAPSYSAPSYSPPAESSSSSSAGRDSSPSKQQN